MKLQELIEKRKGLGGIARETIAGNVEVFIKRMNTGQMLAASDCDRPGIGQVAAAVVDEQGKPVFTAEQVRDLDGAIYNELFIAVQRVHRINIEDAEKK